MAVDPKEIARPATAEAYQRPYGGPGPPTLPRYREAPRPPSDLIGDATVSEVVTWRRGSKGALPSYFAVLQVRPSGKEACRTAQEHAGVRSRCDGVLPLKTLLVERPEEAHEPTGYWITNLPATTPIADPVRRAKMRWRIEHDHRELKHGLGLDHFQGRTWRSGTTTSPSSPPPRPSSPPTARPKSPDAALALYQVLAVLQDLLRCWTGTCTTCGGPLPTSRTRT
ncbi:hypothetical protein [Streptomyces sp. NPDC007205]|uniref:hypothetical protein n=1 Tax=Streptomyces sp. NPDC007205 TaxID=3154316 RepID=UPI003400051B